MIDLFSTAKAEYTPPNAGQDILEQIAQLQVETNSRLEALQASMNEDDPDDALDQMEALETEARERLATLGDALQVARRRAKVTVAFQTATARMSMMRVAGIYEVNEWEKQQRLVRWRAEFGPDAEPTDEELNTVRVPTYVNVEYNMRALAATLAAGVSVAGCMNFDVPDDPEGWLDLPEDLFDDCCAACWQVNPSWRPGWSAVPDDAGEAEKNATEPG